MTQEMCHICKKMYIGEKYKDNDDELYKLKDNDDSVIIVQEVIETTCEVTKKEETYTAWICSKCATLVQVLAGRQVVAMIENGDIYGLLLKYFKGKGVEMEFVEGGSETDETGDEDYEDTVPPELNNPFLTKLPRDNFMYG